MLKYGMKETINKVEGSGKYDKEIYDIILEMNIKRDRKISLSSEEIHEKLYSCNPDKKGEYWEFLEQYEISNGKLTPELALEMADIIYYTNQINCLSQLKSMATELEKKIGISHELAQEFCLVKYRCRLDNPKEEKKCKKIEYDVMTEFLNNKKLNFLP